MYMKYIQGKKYDTSVIPTSSDLLFSGSGGNDEGSAAANSVMHASADGDRGKQTYHLKMPLYPQLEGTRSSVGCSAGSSSGPPYPLTGSGDSNVALG
ncbi:hypothetical protein Tco_0931214 [Tanacetum coccineum]